ncbi:hypothetical protein HK103_007531 [Boothiomyces macroporosus]|uniref:Uncharacterized protein n=1 Tax=Boothiomyces macroporosus TaxID=261099 RepID=A0AAD5UBY0_9FUNG|nr:hypothetical protein HK103_007531 [Boothiomyces macroporosus]
MIIHTIYNLLNNIFLLAFHITDLGVPNYIPAWLFRINYLILVLTATRFLRIFSVLSDKVKSREITITEIGLIICHLACYGNSYYKEYHGIPHSLSDTISQLVGFSVTLITGFFSGLLASKWVIFHTKNKLQKGSDEYLPETVKLNKHQNYLRISLISFGLFDLIVTVSMSIILFPTALKASDFPIFLTINSIGLCIVYSQLVYIEFNIIKDGKISFSMSKTRKLKRDPLSKIKSSKLSKGSNAIRISNGRSVHNTSFIATTHRQSISKKGNLVKSPTTDTIADEHVEKLRKQSYAQSTGTINAPNSRLELNAGDSDFDLKRVEKPTRKASFAPTINTIHGSPDDEIIVENKQTENEEYEDIEDYKPTRKISLSFRKEDRKKLAFKNASSPNILEQIDAIQEEDEEEQS